MTFGKWDESLHNEIEQLKRINSSLEIKNENVTLHSESTTAEIVGRDGTYNVSLNECTCTDFGFRNAPCKHMYKLASELGYVMEFPIIDKKAVKAFNDSLQEEINRYKVLYEQGAISLKKFLKIVNALQSK